MLWAALIATAILATTLYGTVYFFSPIPFEDQWDAYIGFFSGLDAHDWQWAWWSAINEHRIVFSRALFWIDGRLFGGYNAFDVVATLLLMSALCVVVSREAIKSRLSKWEASIVVSLTFGLMFAWTQFENFTSGFQNQFVAVYLFALLAFSQYSRIGKTSATPLAAIGWCVLSALSMANGLAALPVMVIQGLLLRRPIRQIAVLLVTGGLVGVIYMHGQSDPVLPISPAAEPSLLFKVRFFLAFLGSPAYYLSASYAQAIILGLITFALTSSIVLYWSIKKQITPYRSFLVASYGFIIATCLGATHGRWMLGLGGAVVSRYTTPALLGILLVILLALEAATRRRAVILAIAVLGMTLLSSVQIYAVGWKKGMPNFVRDDLYPWRLAVLGPKIGLDHPEYDSLIFPPSAHDRFVAHARYAAAANIGPYRAGWLHDAGLVKYDPELRDDSRCTGYLDGIDKAQAHGWVVARNRKNGPTLIVLANGNETVGYGVTGNLRPDVSAALGDGPRDAGWFGFASTSDVTAAYAYLGGKFCRLNGSGKS